MQLEAVIFDTDGVITRTAAVHFAAWKDVFDTYLATHASGDAARPFTDADYRHHVDGIGRYDGVDVFLRSRGIELPRGEPGDPSGDATVCAVGNTKNAAFEAAVERHGVEPYLTTRRLIEQLHDAGMHTAVISASKNCEMVLRAAGMADLFDVRVDGNDAAELGFPGKPAPDVFLEAARRLGVEPAHAAVVEDAISGVAAGRAGNFGLVIGLDRTRNPAPLAEHADLVVPDAADLEVSGGTVRRRVPASARISDLPDALGDHDLARQIEGRTVAVFLDYDGTLTPIVDRPEDARIHPASLAAVRELAERTVVGVISGRDLDDVLGLLRADGDPGPVWVSGSHGFDVLAPDGTRREFDEGTDALPALDAAEEELAEPIGAIPGARVERKRFAIAVHFRATPSDRAGEVEPIVAAVAHARPELRMAGGKMIFELRPAIDWDKGKALRWLVEAAGLDADSTLAVFLGDDVTDEDAFAEVRTSGVGIIVDTDDRTTAAHDRLDDPDEVRAFLEDLVARLDTARIDSTVTEGA